ncbi:MAG: hypothetical protein HYZ89_03895 [Candidatus Omnitrophica bacterium]|nr:hypothetical protein [Candidatus Omnitrophota bacterium]
MTLRVFMQHLTRALKTKTGRPKPEVVRVARKAYGTVVGYAKQHPDRLKWLSLQVDFLPGGRDLAWYVVCLKEIIADERCAEKERAIRGRSWNSDQKHQPIESVVASVVASMTSRRR